MNFGKYGPANPWRAPSVIALAAILSAGCQASGREGTLDEKASAAVEAVSAMPATPSGWQEYVGRNGWSEEGKWARSVRMSESAYVGPRGAIDTVAVDENKSMVCEPSISRDSHVLNDPFAFGAAKEWSLVDQWFNDMDSDWTFYRDATRDLVKHFNKSSACKGKQIAWQLGNEITSDNWSGHLCKRFIANPSANCPGFKKDPSGNYQADPYNKDLIPFYVDYYLAPALTALTQSPNIDERVNSANTVQDIVLGSIGGARNTKAVGFFERLMNTKFSGKHPFEWLKGKQVKAVVSGISLHYTYTQDFRTTDAPHNTAGAWVEAFREVKPSLKVLQTEELGGFGQEGAGASHAAKIFTRFMDDAARKSLSAEDNRFYLFAWNSNGAGGCEGTSDCRADAWMSGMVSFLGQTRLRALPPETIKVYKDSLTPINPQPERHLLQSVTDDKKVVATIIPERDSAFWVRRVDIDGGGLSGNRTMKLYHIRSDASWQTPIATRTGSPPYRIDLGPGKSVKLSMEGGCNNNQTDCVSDHGILYITLE